jgi:uncharacterized protein (DUF433 family)
MATVTDIGTLIERTPGVCDGRLRIAGTGVSVRRIVGFYKLGHTAEQIVRRIGHVSLAQVYAALSFYHANREAMDAEMAAEEAEAERLEREHTKTAGTEQSALISDY